MFEADYFFGGAQRWNLWFANPNHAGAFIAGWLPLCWLAHGWLKSLASKRRVVFIALLLAVEIAGWWALTHTGSRGALLAIIFSLGLFLLCSRRAWDRDQMLLHSMRAVIIVSFWFMAGFAGRTNPTFVTQDASVGNRLTLWRGGLQMIAASPWRGWGRGESGAIYEEYFQPLEDTTHYKSLVNSYLTLAAEQGVPMLMLVLLPFFYAGMAAWKIARANDSERWLAAVGLAMLVASAMAQVWSNLWIVPELWISPLVAALLIMVMKWRRGFRWQELGYSSALVIGCGVLLWMSGSFLPIHPQVQRDTHGWVTLHSHTTGKRLAVYADAAVLGEDSGRECRRLAQLEEVQSVSIGHVPMAGVDAVLLCGDKASLMSQISQPIWFIHPAGTPPSPAPPKDSCLWLPEYSLSFTDEAWRQYAMQHGMKIVSSPGVGADIRAAWPKVLRGP
ncbi:hypothetical protein BH11VER1_BH11VER1_27780 [soil metagenome]